MIQRIQTIFLFLSAAFMITMVFLPLWQKVDVDTNEKVSLTALELVHEKKDLVSGEVTIIKKVDTYYIAGLAILSALVAIFSIFKFDNRLTQMKIGALNSLLIGASLGFSAYYILDAEEVFFPQIQSNYLPGFYFTAAALFFNALANRFIRKDEKLVKSADRIR